MGGRLLILRGRPEERIPELCAHIGAPAVHVSADFSPFGARRDAAVSAALAEAGVAWQATGSPYLVSPGRVTKDDGTPYKVFTPFFARWKEVGWRAPAASEAIDVTWSTRPGCRRTSTVAAPDPGVTLDLEAGEPAALRRWSEFLAGVSRTTPKTATDPTSRVPAGCRHT